METELKIQKKEAYKQLFGSENIISRPNDSISWESFKEKYYDKENFLKGKLKNLKKSLINLSDISSHEIKSFSEEIHHIESLLKNVFL